MRGSKARAIFWFSVLRRDTRRPLNWQTGQQDGGILVARLSIKADMAASIEEQSEAREAKHAEIEDRMYAWEDDPGPTTGAKDIVTL